MLGQQHTQVLAQLAYQAFEFGDAFVWRHASMLHPSAKTGERSL
jgi:hypothetical protein